MPRTAFAAASLTVLCMLTTFQNGPVFGQTNTATVYGSVTDPSGAVLPHTTIEAVNTSTGARSTATSNAEGQFTLNFLPIGTYKFTASISGFQDTGERGSDAFRRADDATHF